MSLEDWNHKPTPEGLAGLTGIPTETFEILEEILMPAPEDLDTLDAVEFHSMEP